MNLLSFKLDVDFFATQINRQFTDYLDYRADPEAKFIDAFIIDRSGLKFYAFPRIARVLPKTNHDEAESVIVVPYWPNQV